MLKIILINMVGAALLLFTQSCCSTNQSHKIHQNSNNNEFLLPPQRGIIVANLMLNQVSNNNGKVICNATVIEVISNGDHIKPIAEKTKYNFELETSLLLYVQNNVGKSLNCRIGEINKDLNKVSSNYKILTIQKK